MAGHHSCRITLPITGLNCRWKRSSNTECDRRQFSSGALGCYAVELRKASAANRTSSLKREPNKGQIDPNNKANSLRRLRTAWQQNEDALPSMSTNLTQQQDSANQHDHRTHPSMPPHKQAWQANPNPSHHQHHKHVDRASEHHDSAIQTLQRITLRITGCGRAT